MDEAVKSLDWKLVANLGKLLRGRDDDVANIHSKPRRWTDTLGVESSDTIYNVKAKI